MQKETLRVLLIEDDPAHAELVRALLKRAKDNGVELEHAGTLTNGLKRQAECDFDAVLLDLGLPESYGIKTLSDFRLDAPTIATVVLTAQDDVDVALQAVRRGAQDYLVKSRMTAEALLRSLHNAVERCRVEEENRKMHRELAVLVHVFTDTFRRSLRDVEALAQLLETNYAATLEERGRDWLRSIAVSTAGLIGMTSAVKMLDEARWQMKLTDEVNLTEVCKAAAASIKSELAEHSAVIRVADDLPHVRGDRDWLTRALCHLLRNALQYKLPGTAAQVEIACHQEETPHRRVGLVVRDRGRGIAAADAERIFKLFQRVPSEVAGAGAGLAIVHEVAERHGGRAWARPREAGGAEFFMTFARSD